MRTPTQTIRGGVGASLRRLRGALAQLRTRLGARLPRLPQEPAWLWQGQRGASVTEYALLLAVIAVGTAGVLALLQGTIVDVFTNIRNTLLPYAGP